MFLMLYDIEGKKDPHGIRIRLVRSLRKGGAFQLQRSAWLFDGFDEDLLRITNEFRRAGGSVKIMEWLPRTIGEVTKRDAGHARAIAVALLGWRAELSRDRDLVTFMRPPPTPATPILSQPASIAVRTSSFTLPLPFVSFTTP